MATGMISNIDPLIVIRFMLGVVESAVMPAMLIFLSRWFTKSERSRANTFLILGNPANDSLDVYFIRLSHINLLAGAGCLFTKGCLLLSGLFFGGDW